MIRGGKYKQMASKFPVTEYKLVLTNERCNNPIPLNSFYTTISSSVLYHDFSCCFADPNISEKQLVRL